MIYILNPDFPPQPKAVSGGKQKSKPNKKSKKSGNKAEPAARTQNDLSLIMAAIGALVGFLGSLIASAVLTPDTFISYAQNMAPAVNKDITGSLYQTIYNGFVLVAPTSTLSAPLFVLSATLLTAGFAFGLAYVKGHFRQYVSWALVLVLCLIFVTGVFKATGDFRQKIAVEPPDLGYAYDGVIYLKTFYTMADKGFYEGYIEAAANDARLNEANTVRDGKFFGYVHSPLYFRAPVVFYFWRLLTFGNAVGVLYLAILFALGIIVLAYYSGRKLLGESAVFLSAALVPYLVMGLIWYNLFFPDWWAAMALTIGILLWIGEHYWPAAAAFLVAAAFREIVFIFLLVFVVLALVFRKPARIPFGSAAGLFLAVYPFHFLRAAKFIGTKGQEVSSIVSRISLENFVPASSYQVFPYGFFLVPAFLLMIAAVVAWALKKKYDMMALAILAFPYFAYSSSSYWGQHLLPFIILSAFMLLLMRADDIGLSRKSPG